jgi:hypothetical protein
MFPNAPEIPSGLLLLGQWCRRARSQRLGKYFLTIDSRYRLSFLVAVDTSSQGKRLSPDVSREI